VRKSVTLDVKSPGDLVYVLGETLAETGASEYFRCLGEAERGEAYVGNCVPKVDADACKALYRQVEAAIAQDLVQSAHAPAKGGLAVALAKCAFAGELGIDMDLGKAPQADGLRDDELLYSESNGRFVITVRPEDQGAFEALMADQPCACVGTVRDDKQLALTLLDGTTVDWNIMELKQTWKEPLNAI